MNWSNMFTRLMPRTIAGGKLDRVMRLLAFRISERMRLVGLAARRRFQEFLAAPERHRHQAGHVESRARCGDRPDDPQKPAEGNVSRRGSVPKDFIFRPEAAERNNAAD